MSDSASDGGSTAVVLDYLPRGRSDDERPQYKKQPVAYALDEGTFALSELVLEGDADVSIGDRITEETPGIVSRRPASYDDLSGGAQSELEYAVDEIVDRDEQRFVDFYNEAQPITLRLHQLNLLPGIGKKLRNNVLDERKRGRFSSFEDLETRVSGLHNPRQVLVERVLEEIRDDELKYRTFVDAGE